MNWQEARQRQLAGERAAELPKVTRRIEFANGKEYGDFWRAWRKEGKSLREAGFDVRKIDGRWTIWQSV